MRSLRALAMGVLAACTLAACSTTQPLPTDTQWRTHRAQLETLDHWQFSGKLAVKTPHGADTANINWQQHGEETRLTLSGPAGWGRATVTANADILVLEKDGSRRTMALDDSQSLERELGWDMPAALLPFWIRGMPAPGVNVAAQALVQGRLSTLEQSGWSLRYDKYQQVGQISLPARITFDGYNTSGKIILKQWLLDDSKP
jgi:outer membrane lipoprotein LolB